MRKISFVLLLLFSKVLIAQNDYYFTNSTFLNSYFSHSSLKGLKGSIKKLKQTDYTYRNIYGEITKNKIATNSSSTFTISFNENKEVKEINMSNGLTYYFRSYVENQVDSTTELIENKIFHSQTFYDLETGLATYTIRRFNNELDSTFYEIRKSQDTIKHNFNGFTFEYFQGKLIRQFNRQRYTVEYKYFPSGEMRKKASFDNKKLSIEIYFNKKKEIENEVIYYYEENELSDISIICYDSVNNQLLQKCKDMTHSGFIYVTLHQDTSVKFWNRNTNLFITATQIERNEAGLISKSIQIEPYHRTSESFYIYDSKGNWIQKTVFVDGVKSSLDEREISYFED